MAQSILGRGTRHRAGTESHALASSYRAEDAQHCGEGKGFLQQSPSKEPHFTDVSRAA